VTVLARRAPVAKLGAAGILSILALTTLDPWVLGGLALLNLAAAPFFGLGFAALFRKAWPVFAGAVTIVVTLSLFSATRTGTTIFHFGPFWMTTSVLATSLAYALRLLALALPGVLVYATTDPTDLADSLVQHVKAPPRFAIGALAAFRLTGALAEEWRLISMARRARGIDSVGNPLRWLRLFAGTAFGLLVGAIRRGTRLALAMDARGFDSGLPRSIARPSAFGAADWALVLGTLLFAVVVWTVSAA
jgi:energy-coupling factor transport system permease protein